MRLTITTFTKMISLGIFAKDIFLKHVLLSDENDQFDSVQVFTPNMLSAAKSLPLDGGIDEKVKDGIIDALSELSEGDRFLVNGAWVIDFKSREAKFYWKVVEMLNIDKDEELQSIVKKVNEFMKSEVSE
ncbi:MAG: hypothetical protein WCW84_06705 [Sulfurimonas sp.]|jgi:hypothetical protein